MRVCFAGIGSIARRHIRNLSTLCAERGTELHIDALRRSTGADTPEQVENVYTSESDLPSGYDVIFLTGPTAYHAEQLIRLQDKAEHFFIEKPVATIDTVDLLKDFNPGGRVCYVACPMRYMKLVQHLKQEIDVKSVNAVRAISSSFLPDWRPGTDYRTAYSAKRELGGGVDTDLIHEWDYITYLFGMPTEVKMFSGKVSSLEIDSCDYASYTARFGDDMIAELHLDYFGRKSIRRAEIFTEDDTIVADFIEGSVTYMRSGICRDFTEERDEFQKRELAYFLDAIDGGKKTMNGIDHAIAVLKLTQGIIA